LLERVIASLNAAKRPRMPVGILVAANACTDDTAPRLRAYQSRQEKPTPSAVALHRGCDAGQNRMRSTAPFPNHHGTYRVRR